MTSASEFDLGPLTWVKGEIDLALEKADEALRQYEGAADPTHLKFCRTHIHQVHGALAIVGLDGVTQVTDGMEALLLGLEEGRIAATPDTGKLLGQTVAAVRQYLDDLMAGEPNQPLRLLPTYQALAAARGLDKARATDLFYPDLSLRPPKRAAANPVTGDALRALLKSERARFQKGLLAWLKKPEAAAAGLEQMRAALRTIEATQESPAARSFWWISLGFLDSLVDKGSAAEAEVKQLCARIDLQIRRLLEGSRNVAERLMRDALFYVAQAPAGSNPLVDQVRSTFHLDQLVPDTNGPVAATAPQAALLRRLKDALSTTEELWNKFCAGSSGVLGSFAEHARAVSTLTGEIGHTDLKRLGQGFGAIANWLAEQPSRHNDSVAMEVATAILLLVNAQENFRRLGTDFAQQVDLMVARLYGCISGNPASGGDIPLLDEMTRRAQERLLIGQVAREIQNNLAQVEQALDAFFRDPAKGHDLAALDAPLKQISGALTMLGHPSALASLQQCMAQVKRFADPAYAPEPDDFENVAQQLSVLGFFVDSLQHGEGDFDTFVRKLEGKGQSEEEEPEEAVEETTPPPTVESQLEEQKKEAQALIEALKEAPADDRLKDELKQNLQALQKDADLVADHALGETAKAALSALEAGGDALHPEIDAALSGLKPLAAEAPPPSAETLQLAQASVDEIDAELLAIFLEEAQEVLGTIAENSALLDADSHDIEALTTIRRSTHTLKGSGRMVGLTDLGETAWALEQTLNLWLRQELAVTPELLDLIHREHALFTEWVRHLAEGDGLAPDPRALVTQAERLRGVEGEDIPAAPAATPPAAETPAVTSAQIIQLPIPPAGESAPSATIEMGEPEIIEFPELGSPPADPAPSLEDVFTFTLDDVPVGETPAMTEEPAETPTAEYGDSDLAATQVLEIPALQDAPEVLEAAAGLTDDLAPIEVSDLDEDASSALEATQILEIPALQADFPETPDLLGAPAADEEARDPDATLVMDLATLEEEVPATEAVIEAPEVEAPAVDMPDALEDILDEAPVEAFAVDELPADESPLEEETAEPVVADEEACPQLEATAAALEDLLGIDETPAVESIDLSEASASEPLPAEETPAVMPEAAAAPQPEPTPEPEPEPAAASSPTLYDIFREEARGHLDTLQSSFAELQANPAGPTTFAMTRAAHTLGGIAATVGLMPINRLSITLEHALLRRDGSGRPDSVEGLETVRTAIITLEDMFSALARQEAPEPQPAMIEALEEIYQPPHHEDVLASIAEEPVVPVASAPDAPVVEEIPAVLTQPKVETPKLQDELDEQLLPIFLEEAHDIVRGMAEELQAWRAAPSGGDAPRALARLLHTFKGGARMAGAMNLGEMTHALETRLDDAIKAGTVTPALLENIESGCDTLIQVVERLEHGEPMFPEEGSPAEAVVAAPVEAAEAATATVAPTATPAAPVVTAPTPSADKEEAGQRATLRVRADLVDQLVNDAGELSISRARIEGEMRSLKNSLLDLTENVIRLRRQLREVEIQAETQIQAQVAKTADDHGNFDPLELDRFTRFQELTRFMAESVNDVATVQQNLLKNLDDANAALIAQSRLNRSLQQELMSIRMMPFSSQAERLYRIVRQAAKELGKRANLDIRGGQTEMDRSVLDKMQAPIEHMLRNAVAHGIEDREIRSSRGKSDLGEIALAVSQEGNEIIISLSDDGRGLDVKGIRRRAEELGLLAPNEEADDKRLFDFIFHPGFSTATEVTQIAGRGVGMDVVKTEVTSLGGRVEVLSTPGSGTTFRLYLPLTLAVTQTLLVKAAGQTYAIPSTMIEQVLEVKEKALGLIRDQGGAEWLGNRYPYHFLPRLLGSPEALPEQHRQYWVLLLRSGTQRVAVQVDELKGNQEVVVKNIGPQLSRVVGIAGATVLGDGEVVLILNPVALASRTAAAASASAVPVAAAETRTPGASSASATLPTVLVVDDSLTVRKITSRLLSREGYQVLLAKDGVDALEQLIEVIPDVMLSDIEMPRMDGFDLLRNVRADDRLKDLPVIMITSRTADKHRNYALEIGAQHYLGKPYDEDELLSLIAGYVKAKRG